MVLRVVGRRRYETVVPKEQDTHADAGVSPGHTTSEQLYNIDRIFNTA